MSRDRHAKALSLGHSCRLYRVVLIDVTKAVVSAKGFVIVTHRKVLVLELLQSRYEPLSLCAVLVVRLDSPS